MCNSAVTGFDAPYQACQFYVASFWLLPAQFNVLLPPPTLNATQVTAIIKQVSNATGAEVVFKSMCFEMHGLEHEVRNAVTLIMELDIVKVCPSPGQRIMPNLILTPPGLSSRDSLPDRARQRASRVH
jgi:hypothetical protein